jgi:non-specific serine/threonine protein kinase
MKGAGSGQHALPVELTSFVGREVAVHALLDRVRRSRVVTLSGPGGVGKSRLALAIARQLVKAEKLAVSLVELSGLSDAERGVVTAVAAALGVREVASRPLIESLVRALGTSPSLLVLDNCEHLHDACATLVETLLRACPAVRVLATSRRDLGAPGEIVWPVPPLSIPEDPSTQPLDGIQHSEAVLLFVERARALVPEFGLTPANAAAIARICRQLDGLPLAIELAAARVKVLEPQQIDARLHNRISLLTTSARGVAERHRSLGATFDWSYALLTTPAQVVLRRLSVFSGFSLDAAEAVCGDAYAGPPGESRSVLEYVGELVDNSLVAVERLPGADARYRLLETTRQYAADKLLEAGEAELIRRRHAAWCLNLARDGARGRIPGPAALARLEQEHDNLRSALRWCLSANDEDGGLRLGAALGSFWFARGHYSEGSGWLGKLVELPRNQQASLERAVALAHVGAFADMQGRHAEAQRPLE